MKTKPPIQFIYGLILGILVAVLICFFWFGSQKPQPRLTQQDVLGTIRYDANRLNCEIVGEPSYNNGVWEVGANCPGLQLTFFVPESYTAPLINAQLCQKLNVYLGQ